MPHQEVAPINITVPVGAQLVNGPADIAGVGNGDPFSLEPLQADCVSLFYGKAMLIVRSRSVGGEPSSLIDDRRTPPVDGRVDVDALKRLSRGGDA